MRKFAIELNEWYDKDVNGSDIGHTIHKLTYIQEEGRQDSIKDLKRWLLFKGFECEQDLCPCFIKILKYSHYDRVNQRRILQDCTNYSDDTLLDSTEFNENNIMYISFDKKRHCTCGKIHEMKGLSKIIGEQEEIKRQKLREEFNKKTEENNKIHEQKLNQVQNEFKEKIQQQKKENMDLKLQMSRQSIEYEDKIQRITKLSEEENRKNKEKIQNLDQSLRIIDEKEKTFIQNKISAENEYNQTNLQVYEEYYKEEKENIIKEIINEMSEFLSDKSLFEDLVKEIIPKIAEEEEYSKYIKKFMKKKINSIKG